MQLLKALHTRAETKESTIGVHNCKWDTLDSFLNTDRETRLQCAASARRLRPLIITLRMKDGWRSDWKSFSDTETDTDTDTNAFRPWEREPESMQCQMHTHRNTKENSIYVCVCIGQLQLPVNSYVKGAKKWSLKQRFYFVWHFRYESS